MGILGFLLYFFFTAIWIIVIIKMVWKRYGKSKYAYATVVSKSDDTFQEYSIIKGYAIEKTKYIVTFEMQHKTVKLFVTEGFYNSIRVNDSGKLEYKGSYLINFQKTIGIENDSDVYA
ncbi:hypothetical protein RBG61_12555 [Paludicola sp. MB14-C6]|uniref:hypothetical protein n=1 Tax=Paludihabitans sp. MB14-C6 TaxID=3070656 RepID=UPI0027DE3824|nr:hypothetical protein [Paludicola sp. MB14-C6]WMJ22812.1 hypothetical protein RBG61_12555 [Paludicola sp. MB14-C6]